MAFCKEDPNSITAEYTRMMTVIENLRPSMIKMSESYEVEMTHSFLFTMINGKVINAIIKNPATSVSVFMIILNVGQKRKNSFVNKITKIK